MLDVLASDNLLVASEMLVDAALSTDSTQRVELIVTALEKLRQVKRCASFEDSTIMPIILELFEGTDISSLNKNIVVLKLNSLGLKDEAEYVDYFLSDKNIRDILRDSSSLNTEE